MSDTIKCVNPYCNRCGKPATKVIANVVVEASTPVTFINDKGFHLTLGKTDVESAKVLTENEMKLSCGEHTWTLDKG